jgi:hypothetical protein
MIVRVPYVEVDLAAYMQQMDLYNSGERNYTNLQSFNGPVTYPAGYVHLYSIFRKYINIPLDKKDILFITSNPVPYQILNALVDSLMVFFVTLIY